jgi:DNA repair exonuclease SbcCD ATPase subunit
VWLKRIHLRNVGPHEDFRAEFPRGLVAVWGPNGAGKSTLLSAAYAALTNDWDRFPGGKANARRDAAPDGEEAFVEALFGHEGAEFTVRRGLPAGHSLRVAGEAQPFAKDGDIRDRLEALLGIDRRTVGEYVFVPQRGMLGFLSLTEAKRSELFRHLCGTDQAAKIQEAAGEVLARYSADPGVVDSVDDLARQLAAARAEAEAAAADRDALRADVLTAEELAFARKAVAAAEALAQLEADLREAAGRADSLQAFAATAGEAAARAAADADAHEARACELEPAGQAARLALQSLWLYEGHQARVRKAKDVRRALTDEARGREEPPEPGDPPDSPQDLRDERQALKLTIAEAGERVRLFDEERLAACPTCGVTGAALGGEVAAARARLGAAEARLAEVQRALLTLSAAEARWRAEDAARRDWAEWKADWRRRVLAANAALADLDDEAPGLPEGDRSSSSASSSLPSHAA